MVVVLGCCGGGDGGELQATNEVVKAKQNYVSYARTEYLRTVSGGKKKSMRFDERDSRRRRKKREGVWWRRRGRGMLVAMDPIICVFRMCSWPKEKLLDCYNIDLRATIRLVFVGNGK